MSSIPAEFYDVPVVDAALNRAAIAVRSWDVYGGMEDAKDEILAGWSGVSLFEEIATHILAVQGVYVEDDMLIVNDQVVCEIYYPPNSAGGVQQRRSA